MQTCRSSSCRLTSISKTQDQQDIYDPAYVKDLFDRCSGKYIAFSYDCSMGFTGR